MIVGRQSCGDRPAVAEVDLVARHVVLPLEEGPRGGIGRSSIATISALVPRSAANAIERRTLRRVRWESHPSRCAVITMEASRSVRFGIFGIPFPDPSSNYPGFSVSGTVIAPLYRNTGIVSTRTSEQASSGSPLHSGLAAGATEIAPELAA